jgi:peptide/nickel transport system substrate-binding protein
MAHWRARILLSLILIPMAIVPAWAQKDELTIGLPQFPSTFHPSIDSMAAKSYIHGMTRRLLTVYDKDWKLVCMLCTELPTLENGKAVLETTPDGKKGIAITFTIRPDAYWGDGKPVTAKDAQFTWEVGRHPRSGVTAIELYRRMIGFEIKDERTFVLHFDKVGFDYNALNSFDIIPEHLERAVFDRPDEYRTRTLYDQDPTNPGLSNGPYRISEVARGSHVVLDRNPHWKGPAPVFRRVIVKVVENTTALEANLLSGGVDMIAGEIGLSLDQALAFEKRHGSKWQVLYKPGLIYEHIDLNLANPILGDRKVRQALLFALDRDGLNKQLFGGKQSSAVTDVNPLNWYFTDQVPLYPFDPTKAASLLDEAGWKPGPNGIRRNAKGETLSFELMTTAGNRSRELVQQVLQSQWKKVGIDVRIRNEPARVFFGETVTKRKFSAMALFAWLSSPESVPRTTLHSDNIPSEANGWGGQNYTGFSNARLDSLIEEIEVELDKAKRATLWKQIQEIYATELPALPLFYRTDAFILPKWLKGVEPTGHQYPTTLWIERWSTAK